MQEPATVIVSPVMKHIPTYGIVNATMQRDSMISPPNFRSTKMFDLEQLTKRAPFAYQTPP
ncbi:hypothetical protein BC936DRAFT_138942 [Jimgerdemannia flammicorona]|uniref:Uncharacterized protein n=2 Tax=Jimgerdemannia flammicorona TaxID=994334 RepID=A0A433PD00_9FUNG|nr:hypothetical protein BC936DRAFT_138942 [Jimgerdemannia flammicorona]RUS15369.1 hypothetical protein BC938DRAFT_476978 [Jimgerdemannia flammicorona]